MPTFKTAKCDACKLVYEWTGGTILLLPPYREPSGSVDWAARNPAPLGPCEAYCPRCEGDLRQIANFSAREPNDPARHYERVTVELSQIAK